MHYTILFMYLFQTPSFTIPCFTIYSLLYTIFFNTIYIHHFVTYYLWPTTLSHTTYHHTIFDTTFLAQTIFYLTIFQNLSHTLAQYLSHHVGVASLALGSIYCPPSLLTNRSNALHRTLTPRTPMLHGMSIMLSFSSLYGCYLLCTPASAVKVLKTQIPEARQGSNLFLPPVYLILLKTILKITKNTTALVGKKWPSRPARHCQ